MYQGGALYARGGSVVVQGNTRNNLEQNVAIQGGAIYVESQCRLNISSKYINLTGNVAYEPGGAIYTLYT